MTEKQIINKLLKNNWSVYIEHIDKYSQEDYAQLRMETFGASDSAKLLNISPFPNSTPDDLINEKLNKTIDESISLKPSVRMGRDVEHIILAKAEEFFKFNVYKPYNMYKDNESLLSVNFDGVGCEHRHVIPIEAKAVTKYGKSHYDFSKVMYYQYTTGEWAECGSLYKKPDFEPHQFDEPGDYIKAIAKHCGIPEYYYTQIQQQMIPLNAPYGYLVVLDIDNWAMNIFYIPRNEYTIKQLKRNAYIYGFKLGIKKEKLGNE